jgi:hypothetical protein
MARIRTIKPEFWRDEELSALCPESTLLAIGLLNHADDEGYFNANPKLVESDVFPLRELSKNISCLIDDLQKIGYIKIYSGSDGKRYGHIVNFAKHQVINKKNASKIKYLVSGCSEIVTATAHEDEDSRSVPVVVKVGTGNREQGKEGNKKPSAMRFDVVTHLTEHGVGQQIALDWVSVRKTKKAAVTKTAIEEIQKEAKKAGWSLEKALSECVARGWAGFKAEWVDKLSNQKLSFAERDEILKRKRWEEMTGREFPEETQSFWTPDANMELLK